MAYRNDFVIHVKAQRCTVFCRHLDPFFLEGVADCAAGDDVDSCSAVIDTDQRNGWLAGWRAYDRLSSVLINGGFVVVFKGKS